MQVPSSPGLVITEFASPVFFFTGTDSPVREDSSTIRLIVFRTIASAGTLSPSLRIMMSPITSSRLEICCS